MGEAGRDGLRVGFDRTVNLEFHGVTVSSDADLIPYRDLDGAVQLTESAAAELLDVRTGRNIQHGMAALLRQSIYSRLAGYEDVDLTELEEAFEARMERMRSPEQASAVDRLFTMTGAALGAVGSDSDEHTAG